MTRSSSAVFVGGISSTLQVEYCQFPGISIIVDVTPPCTLFPSLVPALPFKEFAIYWSYTRSILKRSYNFVHVWHEDLMSMLEHLDKRCSNKDNTGDNKSIWLGIKHVFETVERVTLCAMRKSKARKMSTLSRSNGVSTIEIPGLAVFSLY